MAKYICKTRNKTKTLTKPIPPFKTKKELSIILPTYNEEKNIEPLVKALSNQFKNTNHEILILDDDSSDKTPEIINALSTKFPVLAIHRYGKKGYFLAYQEAIAMASGKYVLIMDADFSHLPETAKQLFNLREQADIISASRYIKGGKMHAPFLRKYGSMFLNYTNSLILNLSVRDLNNEFEIMKKSDFEKIKFKYPAAFGEFNLELLYRAKLLNLKVKEIQCIYKYRTHGESAMGTSIQHAPSLMKFALSYLSIALKLRFKG